MPHDGARTQHGQGWHVVLLGDARLEVTGQAGTEAGRLDRKEAALLAYVALEGSAPRHALAELLWPDSEGTARVNLRQMLRRLRLAAGGELVSGRDVLTLTEGVTADAAELVRRCAAGQHAEALASEGQLLAPYAFDDLPDFHDWLVRTREQLASARRRAVGAEVERLEGLGQLSRALALAERQLAAEPTSEEAFRRVMRLHYLLGDRTAALGLYAQCREVLRRELGAEPLEETAALAREIERGGTMPGAAPQARGALPASVLRPPVLAGRERAWAQLEAAWQAGQMIFVSGPPGMGKSRLVRDFAASKGAYQYLCCRPGDIHVPYAVYRRNLKQSLAYRPDVVLEPWMRQEVARILPELGDPAHPPPPMTSEADRLRFCEAAREVLGRLYVGMSALVLDDYQFADVASSALGEYVFGSAFPMGSGSIPHVISCFRTGEVPPDKMVMVRRMADAGLVALIELEPLSPEEVRELLGGLELPGGTRHAEKLTRYTGGNPLFVTETVKHLLETGGLERDWPERLPPPGRVAPLIQRRLERLSASALQLAQVAALAKTDFSLELAAEVLETGPLTLGAPLAELGAAQVLEGDAFTHDLVFEAVLEAILPPVRRLLHHRLAEALTRRRASPGTIAHHWVEAGEPRAAVPFLLTAAHEAEDTLQHGQAAALRERAQRLSS